MATNATNAPTGLKLQSSELILSLVLLGLLIIFMIPLPTVVLDLLLAFNIGSTILLLLVVLGVRQPLDFSTFPSLLLLLTLFRLALNVATTRLILLNGNAGTIVDAFGNFAVGGNLVVGLVIFLILIVIQFVVITRGASRVSEVAARFTLDAMPGKQMAIDAEMNAGLIDEGEAKKRRGNLVRESEFYGTMDGASKFVRGDAVAGIIITAINLIGGIIIGVINGMSITQAIRTYSILTIGDGLVTQIPALIISTASGILVTKSTSQSNLGQEIGLQFANSVAPMRLGSVILMGLSIVPGMPTIPFLTLGAGLFFLSQRLTQKAKAIAAEATTTLGGTKAETATPVKSPTEAYLDDFLLADRIALEIGSRLIPLVDSRRGEGLIDKIGGLRRELARQNGLWVPPVRVRDNLSLDSIGYRILVNGREVGRGTIRPDFLLAIDPGSARIPLEGEETREPVFGLPARWIPESEGKRAEMAGYTIVEAPNVLITHLGEVVRRHAHELLSREDLKMLVDKVKESSPAVVDELIPNQLTMGALHRVLTLLLEERVPISNLTRILESLATYAPTIRDPVELSEKIRIDIGRTICDRFREETTGRLRAIVLDPRLEVELRTAIRDKQLTYDPAKFEQLVMRLVNEQRSANARGQEVALLCDSSLRRPLRLALARSLGDLTVISYQEIPNDLLMEPVALIRLDELGGQSSVATSLGFGAGR